MFFVAVFEECSFVKSGVVENGVHKMVEGPITGTRRVLVEADNIESARKSAQRFEHIAVDWTKGLFRVKSIEMATEKDQKDLVHPSLHISWYEEHWSQRR